VVALKAAELRQKTPPISQIESFLSYFVSPLQVFDATLILSENLKLPSFFISSQSITRGEIECD
jgi:hypothetical protein